MDLFTIEGGYSLNGSVQICGAKNVALKILIASLLTDEQMEVANVPLISDVFSLVSIVESLGVEVAVNEEQHRMLINPGKMNTNKITSSKFSQLRASFLLLIPLLQRFKEVEMPLSGGDKIGARPIERTLDGLIKMGATIITTNDSYKVIAKKLRGVKYTFAKNTHTGTEALIMAGVLAEGETVLENASLEPEVDELIHLLNLMGGKIKRDGRTVIINGVRSLHGAKIFIIPDRNEVVTFAAAAVITGGQITIESVEHAHLTDFYKILKSSGVIIEEKNNALFVDGKNSKLKAINITTAPHPGFMTDWQAPWAVMMTKAKGEAVVHETIFEKRFDYVWELLKMGAKIEFFNPEIADPEKVYNFNLNDKKDNFHAIKIKGPQQLIARDLVIPDLRAGATLVLAALGAKGTSTLKGVEHIDRGYEAFEVRLAKLGAKIKRIKSHDGH